MTDLPSNYGADTIGAKQLAKKGTETDLQFAETVLESTNEGFVVWDAGQRLVAWSEKCPDFWYQPDHILRPGMPMIELLRHITVKGGFGPGDHEKLAQQQLQKIRRIGGNSEDEFEMHDGRIIHVQRHSMRDGGHSSTYTDITARRRAEKKQQSSEQQFRTLFDHIPISVWIEDWSAVKSVIDQLQTEEIENFSSHFRTDKALTERLAQKTSILNVNAKTLQMYRATGQKEFGLFANNNFLTDDKYPAYCDTLAAFARGEPHCVVSSWEKTLDGDDIYVRDTVFIADEYHDTWAQVVHTKEDITSRKQTEVELEETLSWLEEAQRIGRVGHWVWDETGQREIFASQEMHRILGNEDNPKLYSWDEFLDSIHPDDREHTAQVQTKAADSGTDFEVDYRIVLANGETRTIRERGEPVYDEAGKHTQTVGTIQDITKQTERDRALHESEARYTDAARIAKLGHWSYDEVADRLDHCSDELARIHGITSDAYMAMVTNTGKDIERAHPDDRETYQKVVTDAQRNATPYDVEYRIIRPGGEVRHIREIGEPVCDDNGKLIRSYGTLQDITDRKIAEFSLREAHDELEERVLERTVELETARNEAEAANVLKSQLITTMSHELRTPLTSIIGSLRLIANEIVGSISDEVKDLLNVAVRNSDHLAVLVNDILDIEKISSGAMNLKVQQLNLSELVQLSVKLNEGYGEEYDISFATEELEPFIMVLGNEMRLLQVMANLLSNAAKFSPKGDCVTVAIKRIEKMVKVSVSDNGPGIADDIQGRIFDKFVRGDNIDARNLSGAGLGLNITRSIIEMHNGTISFDTETGVGTTFYFTLPTIE